MIKLIKNSTFIFLLVVLLVITSFSVSIANSTIVTDSDTTYIPVESDTSANETNVIYAPGNNVTQANETENITSPVLAITEDDYIGVWQKFESWNTELPKIPEYELIITKIENNYVYFSYLGYRLFSYENQIAKLNANMDVAPFTIYDENGYILKGNIIFEDNSVNLDIDSSTNPLIITGRTVFSGKAYYSLLSGQTLNNSQDPEIYDKDDKQDTLNNIDATTAKTPIPQTGVTVSIISVTTLLVIFSIVAFVKYKKINNI